MHLHLLHAYLHTYNHTDTLTYVRTYKHAYSPCSQFCSSVSERPHKPKLEKNELPNYYLRLPPELSEATASKDLRSG